jgi:hypothetical protein
VAADYVYTGSPGRDISIAMKKLYVNQIVPINTVKDVLICLYGRENGAINFYANPTFLDEGLENIDCAKDRRSFDDIFLLVQTYFPGATEVDVMKAMAELNMSLLYCWNINKMVFMGKGGETCRRVKDGDFDAAVKYYEEKVMPTQKVPVRWAEGTYSAERLSQIWEQI